MGTPLRCYICDIPTNRKFNKTVFDINSQHSKRPIAELLKRFQHGGGTIRARDGSNACILCDECIEKLNAYDEAFYFAEQIEKQLKAVIARTEKRYENVKDPIEIHESNQNTANGIPKISGTVAADPFDSDEMQTDHNSEDFEYDNDEDAMDKSEEEIESEVDEDFDSDDSFVWPKPKALKRKREKNKEKEKGKENVKKKPHIYKCIDCPADYRSKYEMQVNSAFNLLFIRQKFNSSN